MFSHLRASLLDVMKVIVSEGATQHVNALQGGIKTSLDDEAAGAMRHHGLSAPQ